MERSNTPTLLITRPQPLADQLRTTLSTLGMQSFIEPLLQFQHSPEALPKILPRDHLIITSQQALRVLETALPNDSVCLWCVGKETAHQASQLGIQNVFFSEGGSTALLKKILSQADPSVGRFIHLAGDPIRLDLAKALRHQGFKAEKHTVYQTQYATTLSASLKKRLQMQGIHGALFYSQRTLQTFQNLCAEANLIEALKAVPAVCFSPSIAAEAHQNQWHQIHTLTTPSTEHLLTTLKMLYACK